MNEACRICGNTANQQQFTGSERMFGWGDSFPYFQCGRCGCLQIAAVPDDLARFYPPHYQSFAASPLPQRGLKAKLASTRDFFAATNAGLLGRVIGQSRSMPGSLTSLAHVPVRKNMRILDVGCGSGQLLAVLHRAGFKHLAGIDPFVPNDIKVAPGVSVRKISLDRVGEQFDLIMLHHVFEHVPSGLEMLEHCRRRLTPLGKVLLRFPTADSDAWQQYRECWVQLDAPRHLFLHTKASLDLLAKKAGLKIEKWFCDSTDFQFWGSELFRRGRPLFDGQGTPARPSMFFEEDELKAFAEKARMANAAQRGDQVVVILGTAG
jgi:SAM-dependent methyltransferase